MGATRTLISAEQLEGMSFPNERVELSNGELIRMPPAGFEHGWVISTLNRLLQTHVSQHQLGIVLGADTGFRLGEYTVRAPDIAFVTAKRLKKIGITRGFWPAAPDLAIEVFSPSDTQSDLLQKIQEYFQAGVRAVWVLFPAVQQVYVYRDPKQITVLGPEDTLTGGEMIPGFSVVVGELFPDLR